MIGCYKGSVDYCNHAQSIANGATDKFMNGLICMFNCVCGFVNTILNKLIGIWSTETF
jgi:hypothetical protein